MTLPLYGTSLYTDKVPKKIRDAMKAHTQAECVLISREPASRDSRRRESNCYINVARQVKKYGGTSIFGWMLDRRAKYIVTCDDGEQITIKSGLWNFEFHAIWQDPVNSQWRDITLNKDYDQRGARYTTFWLDATRRADVEEATAFNSIFALEYPIPEKAAKAFTVRPEVGKLYWYARSLTNNRELQSHSGAYRWRKDNPKNKKLFEQRLKKLGYKNDPNENMRIDHYNDLVFDFA